MVLSWNFAEPPVGIEPTTCSLRVSVSVVPRGSTECIPPGRPLSGHSPERCCPGGNCADNCPEASVAVVPLARRCRDVPAQVGHDHLSQGPALGPGFGEGGQPHLVSDAHGTVRGGWLVRHGADRISGVYANPAPNLLSVYMHRATMVHIHQAGPTGVGP